MLQGRMYARRRLTFTASRSMLSRAALMAGGRACANICAVALTQQVWRGFWMPCTFFRSSLQPKATALLRRVALFPLFRLLAVLPPCMKVAVSIGSLCHPQTGRFMGIAGGICCIKEAVYLKELTMHTYMFN